MNDEEEGWCLETSDAIVLTLIATRVENSNLSDQMYAEKLYLLFCQA